jgi:putative ABC transport system permease protein
MLTRLFIASFQANIGRTLLALAGITLGVALGLAVHVINESAVSEMQQATRTLSGDADLTITSGKTSSGGFDEEVFAKVLADPRVAGASPVVEAEATPRGAKRSIKFIGIDLFRAVRLQPGFAGELRQSNDQFAALRPDSVMLNQAARAQFADADPRELALRVDAIDTPLKVIGRVELPQYKEPLAVMDIAGAQVLFKRSGLLSRIDIRLVPGANASEVIAALRPALPPGVTIATVAQIDQQSAAVSRAYRINLTVLSLVALFTGGFLVFCTQSLSVVRRRAQFALLRTLGVTRGELTRTLLAEGAALGVLGGIAGAALGLAMAAFALDRFGADMGSGFFSSLAPAMKWNVPAIAVFVSLGIVAGLAGAWLPARSIAAEAPARALKASDGEGQYTNLPPKFIGVALLGLALLLLLIPPLDGIPWFAYASIASLLFGVLALTPWASAGLLSRLPPPGSVISALAKRHVENTPAASAAGIAGVVASFSLMIAMLIMVVSFRSSLEQWLTGVLNLDLYVRQAGGESNGLNPSTGAAFAAIDGIERAEFFRYRSVILDSSQPERPPVSLVARSIGEDIENVLKMVKRAPQQQSPTLPEIWISEAIVDLYGFSAGSKVALPINGIAREVYVAGVWRDYARSFGAIAVSREQYVTWTGDTQINDVALTLKPRMNKASVIARIRAMPDGARYEIADAAEIRKLSLSIFDRSFAVTYALEIAAIFVGLAGISATFSASAWARRREFGMLRHLGVSRREIAQLLATEGALLGGLGAMIGLALGIVIALVLIFVVNRQSFHWSMELHIPWLALTVLSLVLITLTTISATVSGRYAMSKQVVSTVKEDA